MPYTFVTIPGSAIIPGDVLRRIPGVQVVSADPVDPAFPHSQTLHMADGSLYFIDPAQEYVVARPVDETPVLGTMLVTGPCTTDVECDDLTAFGFDVADQYGLPVAIATDDTDVSQFAAVVVYGPSLSDPASKVGTPMIIEATAALYDVPVIIPQSLQNHDSCEGCEQAQTITTVRDEEGVVFCRDCAGETPGCLHCFADEPTTPVHVDGMWVPMCGGCARITKAVKPSPWNGPELEADVMVLFGVAA